MKVTNWRKKLIASIVAGGTLAPGLTYAISIPLGDPSFENYPVSAYVPGGAPDGYAYANAYRFGANKSAWVDDLDSPSGYTADDVQSNWLYRTAYGEDGPPYRGAPRTGDQAMHGRANYSAQETTALFQAEKTY